MTFSTWFFGKPTQTNGLNNKKCHEGEIQFGLHHCKTYNVIRTTPKFVTTALKLKRQIYITNSVVKRTALLSADNSDKKQIKLQAIDAVY